MYWYKNFKLIMQLIMRRYYKDKTSTIFVILFAEKRQSRIGIISLNFRFTLLSLSGKRTELSEFIFRIIHNWGRHFVRVSRAQADEMDQTVLLSVNSIAVKFEFEIRRASAVPIGQNNFSADQSSNWYFRNAQIW